MTNYKSYFFTKEKRSDSYFAIYWIIIVSSCFTNTLEGTVNIYKVGCFDSNIILATICWLFSIAESLNQERKRKLSELNAFPDTKIDKIFLIVVQKKRVWICPTP